VTREGSRILLTEWDALVATWERCSSQMLSRCFDDLLCERDTGYDCS
jgi:hypothetical protein